MSAARDEGEVVLFDVERTTVAGQRCLRVVGELDVATAPQLAAAAERELAERPRHLVVDLTPTTFLDSSGARQLALLARQAKDERVGLQVVCPESNGPVRLVIDLLELRAVVPVVATLPGDPTGSAGRD